MEEQSYRRPTDLECRILRRLISAVPSGAGILSKQIDDAWVRKIDSIGSLKIKVTGVDRYADVTGPLVTGQQEDVDTIGDFGPYINFLLFLRNGVIDELEVYKDDGQDIRSKFDPDKFILFYRTP